MSIFFILCGIVSVLIYAAYAIFTKSNTSSKFCSVFYSIVFCIYLCACSPILSMLLDDYNVNFEYIYIFVIIATALAVVSPVLTAVSIFFKKERVSNIMFNTYFFVLTAAYIGLLINCLMTHSSLRFILVFLPVHYILAMALAASSLQNIAVKSQKIKIFISYSLLALVFVAGIFSLIVTSVQSKIINSSLFALIIIFLCIAFAGIVSTIIYLKTQKNK